MEIQSNDSALFVINRSSSNETLSRTFLMRHPHDFSWHLRGDKLHITVAKQYAPSARQLFVAFVGRRFAKPYTCVKDAIFK